MVNREEYNKYMRSPEWEEKRQAVLARAKGKCERCGERGLLQVHHLHYVTFKREPLTDLEALCEDCHDDADSEREDETEEWLEEQRQEWEDERWEARLDGWASKVFGSDWQQTQDRDYVEKRFREWLDEHGDD